MLTLLTIIGARPQMIKAAALSRAIEQKYADQVREIIVHTGQHYDANMSDIFFQELQIPTPQYNLHVGSGTHGKQTGQMLEKIEVILLEEKPDVVLVYGDTNSTIAGALAASKLHIKIAHVEAGLRSFNKKMPEEINRILTDHCADFLFVPAQNALQNLQNEGIEAGKITVCGDIMYDTSLHYAQIAEQQSRILPALQLQPKQYVLATIHRAENTDVPERLKNIVEALQQIAENHRVVLPIHPRTRKYLQNYNINIEQHPNITLTDPVGYLDMVSLEKNALLILTDSGGVQKEAFFYDVPCVTLRDETEWTELVDLGWNTLASPTDTTKIVQTALHYIQNTPAKVASPYGKGNTAEIILETLVTKCI